MTRDEYRQAVERVLLNAEKLRPDNREVVIVMSRDMYEAMAFYEAGRGPNWPLVEMGHYGRYETYRIGVVEENGTIIRNMMEAALVGMEIQNIEVRVGDMLVVSEDKDNHLYRMTNINPVQFTDTGLVVRFELPRHHIVNFDPAAAADFTVTIDQINVDALAALAIGGNLEYTEPAVRELGRIAEGVAWARTPTPTRRKRKSIMKEPELSPGDTKLLDEFLGGFLRSGA